MFGRIFALALTTLRDAARDRVPLALFGAGLAVGMLSLLVAAMSLGRDHAEVVAVLTSSALSLFALLSTIVLGATLLHKDIERKTLFPILARPVRRWEVVLGKHLGLLGTVATFCFLDGALALTLTALVRQDRLVLSVFIGWIMLVVVGAYVLLRARDKSTPWLLLAPLLFAVQYVACGALGDLRMLVLVTTLLAVVECVVVAAVTLAFGSFSSPGVTAICTVGLVLIGRSSDLLAKLPIRIFGEGGARLGAAVARVVPNLYLYTPPRLVASGRSEVSVLTYVLSASGYGLLYAALLLVVASLLFQKRDFA